MRYMKYVVMQSTRDSDERIYIFDPQDAHDAVAEQLARNGCWRPIRAGLVSLRGGKLVCYGESVTLKLKADGKQDSELLAMQIDPEWEPT